MKTFCSDILVRNVIFTIFQKIVFFHADSSKNDDIHRYVDSTNHFRQ